MTGNLAIFDPSAPARILAAARDDQDWGIAYLILREGMHPTQIVRLRPSDLHDHWLTWKRVKNEKPREALIPDGDLERLKAFLAHPRLSRKQMWARMLSLTRRAGFDATPRELRKTAILGWLRDYKDRRDTLELVSARAGCSLETVTRYYLDLTMWEQAGAPSERRDG